MSIAPYRAAQPGGVRPGLPRAAVRPAGRRRDGPRGGDEAGGSTARRRSRSSDLERPAGASTGAGATPGSACSTTWRATSWRRIRGSAPLSHQSAYERAVRLMRRRPPRRSTSTTSRSAPRRLRPEPFGQGCLLARRLVERGVPFVEVALSAAEGAEASRLGHAPAELRAVKKLSGVLDPAWATLIDDLAGRAACSTRP